MATLNACLMKMQHHGTAHLFLNSRSNFLHIRPLLSEVTVSQVILTQGLPEKF